jgi:hypothetical protein
LSPGRIITHYTWSSAHCYFSPELSKIVDTRYVNELFGSQDSLFGTCDSKGRKELCIIKSEYGEIYDIDIYAIDTRSRKGQRLRGELLLNLKEGAGLSYKEIAEIEIFKNLKFSTLRSMYRNMKQKRSR